MCLSMWSSGENNRRLGWFCLVSSVALLYVVFTIPYAYAWIVCPWSAHAARIDRFARAVCLNPSDSRGEVSRSDH